MAFTLGGLSGDEGLLAEDAQATLQPSGGSGGGLLGNAAFALGQGLLAGPASSDIPLTGLENLGAGIASGVKQIRERDKLNLAARQLASKRKDRDARLKLAQAADSRAQAAAGRAAATESRQSQVFKQQQDEIAAQKVRDAAFSERVGTPGTTIPGLSADQTKMVAATVRSSGSAAGRKLAETFRERKPVSVASGAQIVNPNTGAVVAEGTPKPPKELTGEEKKVISAIDSAGTSLNSLSEDLKKSYVFGNFGFAPSQERFQRLKSNAAALKFAIATAAGQGALQAPDAKVVEEMLGNVLSTHTTLSTKLEALRTVQQLLAQRRVSFQGLTSRKLPAGVKPSSSLSTTTKPAKQYNPATGKIEPL